MIEKEKIFTVHIGDTDIYEWTQGVGKDILMPKLLDGCERILNEELDELKCARIEVTLRGKQKAFDFAVQRNHIDDTLSKIMEWALDTENYEMCQRVQKIENQI